MQTQFSPSVINQNFLIRWKNQSEKATNLIGAGRYHLLVGKKLKDKHFNKVMENGHDRFEFKIRESLEIHFISR